MTQAPQSIRFAGFTVDLRRASLLDPAGVPRKLRPKSFDMLCFLLRHPGQIVTKDELLLGVWGHTNLDDDGLTQCARDIRIALGDDARTLLKTIPRRGYLLEDGPVAYAAEPETEPQAAADPTPAPPHPPRPAAPWRWRAAAALVFLLAMMGAGLAFNERAPPEPPPTLVFHPLTALDTEPETATIAASVTDRLLAGLSRIPAIHVSTAPPASPRTAAPFPPATGARSTASSHAKRAR